MAAPMDSGNADRYSEKARDEEMINQCSDSQIMLSKDKNKQKAIFFGAVGFSLFMGFGFTMYRIKKNDPIYFKKILKPSVDLPETGVQVASKALAYASVISVTCMGLLTLATFKFLGVKNAREFHEKLQTYFPSKGPQGRSDFKDLHELVDYLETEDRKAEILKKKNAKSQS